MKIILTIFIFISSCLKAQHSFTVVANVTPSRPIPVVPLDRLDTIFMDDMHDPTLYDNEYDYGAYSTYSSNSMFVYSPDLPVMGLVMFSYKNWVTNLEDATTSVEFKPMTDGNGIGIGNNKWFSSGPQPGSQKYCARVILMGPKKGQLVYAIQQGFSVDTAYATSGTNYFPITNGNWYRLSRIRTLDSIYIKIQNVPTTDSMVLAIPAWFLGERANKPTVFCLGGTDSLRNLTYTSTITKRPKMLFMGNSLMQGCCATTAPQRYYSILKNYFADSLQIDAGSGNNSQDLVDYLPEALLINPQSVYINIGRNPTLTQANIDTLVDNFTRRNIPVYIATVIPNGNELFANNSIIRGQSGKPLVTVVDLDPTMTQGTSSLYPAYRWTDGTHLSDAGDAAVAGYLISVLTGYLTPR